MTELTQATTTRQNSKIKVGCGGIKWSRMNRQNTAADKMAEALEGADLQAPVVPVIANVTAAKVVDPAEIRRLLVSQVTSTVRWRESVGAAVSMGVDRFVELGAGKVLTGLVKRIAPDAVGLNAGTPGEIEALLKVL